MKKDFVQLVKDLRVSLRPEWLKIANASPLEGTEFDKLMVDLEAKRDQIIKDSGFTMEEFDSESNKYSFDFSSENPEEWIIQPKETENR